MKSLKFLSALAALSMTVCAGAEAVAFFQADKTKSVNGYGINQYSPQMEKSVAFSKGVCYATAAVLFAIAHRNIAKSRE